MFTDITPVILTRNEAPNIARTVGQLATWATDIVVVDSNSEDDTLAIAAQFPQVRSFQRQFDSHAGQWQFALDETGIATTWILALDADYFVPAELVDEIQHLDPPADVSGYRVGFDYAIHGRTLRGSAYPPITALFRKADAHYVQDGHTQRVIVAGAIEALRHRMVHDDRKPLDGWVESQRRYMKLEAAKLAARTWDECGWKDRLRKLQVVSPLVMAVYCLLVQRAVLDGRAGWFYSAQRVFSETLLSLYLLEQSVMPAATSGHPSQVVASPVALNPAHREHLS